MSKHRLYYMTQVYSEYTGLWLLVAWQKQDSSQQMLTPPTPPPHPLYSHTRTTENTQTLTNSTLHLHPLQFGHTPSPILLCNLSLLELDCDAITEGPTNHSVDLAHIELLAVQSMLVLMFVCVPQTLHCLFTVLSFLISQDNKILSTYHPTFWFGCEMAS